MKISASEQVAAWLVALPPQTKHRVRLGIRSLGKGKGDIKGLQGSLEGYNRLRVGGLRIIYHQISGTEIRLIFGNTRNAVYEMYEQILRDRK